MDHRYAWFVRQSGGLKWPVRGSDDAGGEAVIFDTYGHLRHLSATFDDPDPPVRDHTVIPMPIGRIVAGPFSQPSTKSARAEGLQSSPSTCNLRRRARRLQAHRSHFSNQLPRKPAGQSSAGRSDRVLAIGERDLFVRQSNRSKGPWHRTADTATPWQSEPNGVRAAIIDAKTGIFPEFAGFIQGRGSGGKPRRNTAIYCHSVGRSIRGGDRNVDRGGGPCRLVIFAAKIDAVGVAGSRSRGTAGRWQEHALDPCGIDLRGDEIGVSNDAPL